MKTICLIPARGGSVRVPKKNIRSFRGRPVIAYSIENAHKCGLFDQIVVSTDDDEIHRTVAKLGVLVTRRPRDDGTKGTQELAGEYLQGRPDVGICCVLYATAPLLRWTHLVEGFQALFSTRSRYAYAIHEDTKQDIGAMYWGFAQAFREGIPLDDGVTPVARLAAPRERAIDINTPEDWEAAERMYEALRRTE